MRVADQTVSMPALTNILVGAVAGMMRGTPWKTLVRFSALPLRVDKSNCCPVRPAPATQVMT
jgi:hypothetical protein